MRMIFAALLILVTSVANAQGYMGVGGGSTTAKMDDCGISGFSCSSDGTSSGFKVFAGYQFSPKVSGELSYVDLGKAAQAASGSIGGTTVNADATFKTSGIAVDLVGTVPVGDKVGLL